jgi:hypothetical protein
MSKGGLFLFCLAYLNAIIAVRQRVVGYADWEEGMSDELETLEARRKQLYGELEQVGDFRPGLISVNYRKCGKKNCACARRGHPGHGPQYLWNSTFGGKSAAENLPLGPRLEKATKEIASYQRFLQLTKEIVEVNQKICRLRPADEIDDERELEALKKNLRRKFAAKPSRK